MLKISLESHRSPQTSPYCELKHLLLSSTFPKEIYNDQNIQYDKNRVAASRGYTG